MASSIEVRKVVQDVVLFVWFKHGIVPEVPLRLRNPLPHLEIMPEFSNNLRIAVWVETFRLDFRLRRYFATHLTRMTSSAELFAIYVSHIFYTLRKDSRHVHEQFFDTLSIATYFGLRCWENDYKAFLHTSVELFCAFYEKEIRQKFENQGTWNDFNTYLEINIDLPKYKSLNDDNKCPSEYFEHTKESSEKVIKVNYALQLFLLQKDTQAIVESNNNAVSFGESVADELKELCQLTTEEVLEKFAETDSRVEVENLSSSKDQEVPGNISKSPRQYLIRKITQDVLRFVWFKQRILNEEPTLDSSFISHTSPEFMNNLRIAVWMQTFICDSRFKGFLGNHFNRMTSSAKLFAKYVSYACYTFYEDTESVYDGFFHALSIATYFTLRSWEKGSKAFLNTTVELFCAFYELELLKKFEGHGSLKDFNEFLESHFDLPKYKSLIDDNILPSEYFEQTKDEREKHDKIAYDLQLNLLNEITETSAECYERVIIFSEYVAGNLEQLCKHTFDEILEEFNRVDYQVKEIYRQIDAESSGGLASELDSISLRKCQSPENIISSPSTEKELVLQKSTASNSSEILTDLVKGIDLETVQDTSEALEREVEQVQSVQGHEEVKDIIPSRSKSKKRELLLKIRKITKDVMMFVWFKHCIIQTEPEIIWSPRSELTFKFLNNFRVSVWMQSFRNKFKWKDFSKSHFKRMISSAELFANYVSYACYASIENTTNAFAGFLEVVALVTYFTIHCWEEGPKEYLNTSVELVCSFFEQEFLETFEDQGNWSDFNDYIEANFDLPKYELLIADNIWPWDYFQKPKEECVEDSESFYTSQCTRHGSVTATEVETREKAVSFAVSVTDELEELCQDTLGSIILDFPQTEILVDEICFKRAEEAAGGLTKKVGHVSSLKVKEEPENIPSSLDSEKKELASQVRKVTQIVQLFVWYKQKIITEEPTQYLNFIPNIPPELVNNLCIAVSMHTFRNSFKWECFLKRHFKRMASTAELFAEYVSFACYTLIEYTKNVPTVFFKILSLVTYIVLYFWDKGYKESLNTSVELVCTFFEKELCKNFEDQGGWKHLNEYLVKHFDLKKYKKLLDKNMLLTEYLKRPQSKHEENINSAFSLQCLRLAKTTRSEVESNKNAISFVESVEDKMEQLCLQSLEEIIKGFASTDHRVGEICEQTMASGGLAREVDVSSEIVGAQENSQVNEMNQQTVREASGISAREKDISSDKVATPENIQVGEINLQTVGEFFGRLAREVETSENAGAPEKIQVGEEMLQTVGEASGGLAREEDISSEKVVTPENIQAVEINLQTGGEISGGLAKEVDTSLKNVGSPKNNQLSKMSEQTVGETFGGLAREVDTSSENVGAPENIQVGEEDISSETVVTPENIQVGKFNLQTVGEISGGLAREVETSSKNDEAPENIQVGEEILQTVGEASGGMSREEDISYENVGTPENIKVVEMNLQTVGEISGGLAKEVDISSEKVETPENIQVKETLQTVGEASGGMSREANDTSENVGAAGDIPESMKSEVKKQLHQMIKSHCLDIQSTLPIVASSQLNPRFEKIKHLLHDISKDYSELEEVIQAICEKHGV